MPDSWPLVIPQVLYRLSHYLKKCKLQNEECQIIYLTVYKIALFRCKCNRSIAGDIIQDVLIHQSLLSSPCENPGSKTELRPLCRRIHRLLLFGSVFETYCIKALLYNNQICRARKFRLTTKLNIHPIIQT